MYTHVDILCYRFQRPKFTMIETIANDQKAYFKLSCVEGVYKRHKQRVDSSLKLIVESEIDDVVSFIAKKKPTSHSRCVRNN